MHLEPLLNSDKSEKVIYKALSNNYMMCIVSLYVYGNISIRMRTKAKEGQKRGGVGGWRGGEVDSDTQLEQGHRLAKAGPVAKSVVSSEPWLSQDVHQDMKHNSI